MMSSNVKLFQVHLHPITTGFLSFCIVSDCSYRVEGEEGNGVVSENIIILTCCTIIKMPATRVDKFSAGRIKCRSPM